MTEPRALSFEAFARELGLTTTADVDSHIHAGLRCAPQTKTYARWNARTLASLQDARDAARKAYRAAILAGEVRELTSLESMTARAAGHPDNASTQAARRILAKRAAREGTVK